VSRITTRPSPTQPSPTQQYSTAATRRDPSTTARQSEISMSVPYCNIPPCCGKWDRPNNPCSHCIASHRVAAKYFVANDKRQVRVASVSPRSAPHIHDQSAKTTRTTTRNSDRDLGYGINPNGGVSSIPSLSHRHHSSFRTTATFSLPCFFSLSLHCSRHDRAFDYLAYLAHALPCPAPPPLRSLFAFASCRYPPCNLALQSGKSQE